MPTSLAPYSKAIGALLGSLTPAVVIGILAAVHVTVAPALAGLICTIAAAIGAYIFPANQPAAAAQHAADPTPPQAK